MRKLKQARVLLAGARLGSATRLSCAAGVGQAGLVDFDVVDASNLLGSSRMITARARSACQRSSLRAAPARSQPAYRGRDVSRQVTSHNALDLLSRYDVVVDGTDNFAARYLLNDACMLTGKPLIYGAVYRFEGQVSVFGLPGGPCYRCLLPEPPPPGSVPSCAEAGVLGVLPGTIGTLQATEALKLVLGAGELLAGRLLLYDALAMTFDTIRCQSARTARLRRARLSPLSTTRPIAVWTHATDPQTGFSAAERAPGQGAVDAGERLLLYRARAIRATAQRLDGALNVP